MGDNTLPDDDTITLVLCDNRILASKKKLARKSRYFQCLFSKKFCDSTQKEFDINYDFQPGTLQDFVDWTSSNETTQFDDGHTINKSLLKYVHGSFTPLLTLLELGFTFMVDSFISDVMDVLIHHWLEPEIVIDLWLLTQEMNYTKLKDVAFAACLDRFMEIPMNALLKLPKEKFLQLIRNVNIRSTANHLHSVTKAWIEKNNDGENLTSEISNRTERLKKAKEPVIRYKDTSGQLYKEGRYGYVSAGNCEWSSYDPFRNEEMAFACSLFLEPVVVDVCLESTDIDILSLEITSENLKNKERWNLYYWDYKKSCTVTYELNNITVPFEKIKGMEVVGRGFSIYFVGGVYDSSRSDLEKFNMDIWRYCTLSEKLYYVARLPRPRKDMLAFFMANKLMLLGGLGEKKTVLTTIDVLNIHTGEWTQAADIPNPPLPFEKVGGPPGIQSYVYTYHQCDNKWSSSEGIPSMYLIMSFIPNEFYVGANEYEWPSTARLLMTRERFGNYGTSTVHPTASIPYWQDTYYLNLTKSAIYDVLLNEEGVPEKCVTEEFGKKELKYPTRNVKILNPASLYRQVTH
ncbi:uncharacterized protein LOC105704474 [Orussus abietinus]|uniref:uncharacterized protein LOC105704474 n=1 Tax=Orussus abietinus TaxID=222816 RepID=UPI0006262132|nr:uncharacterized protein LOC105704474 [Orussus abietinus]XP_012289126.1 uncharacterized protein LOC105704474 [Orussus abietinus]XP_012289127.1 uncharacterized protein LOC105704474 [Orussus abietinus]